jgi:D-sedoheptulose 7-phosphate isomerase
MRNRDAVYPTPVKRRATRWERYSQRLATLLDSLVVTDGAGYEVERESGFRSWHEWTLGTRERRGCVFLVGNGASASMASHISADIAKGARIRTQVFTDVALMTAVANDVSYEEVFATPLGWSMHPGDMLVAVSSSGNSANIVRAVEAAGALGGHAITLSAMGADNAVRRLGALNFHVPAETYGLAETTHAAILHYWVDRLIGVDA